MGNNKITDMKGISPQLRKRLGTTVGIANTGVVAEEYGDGRNFTTVLHVNVTDALTLADNADIADGYLLYTLPAGAIIIHGTMMSMATQAADATLAAGIATEAGLGTVIGTGAVAVLNGTAEFEDIITGQVGDVDGTADIVTLATTKLIEVAAAHTIHYNVACSTVDTAGVDLSADISGTVVIHWTSFAT